MTPSRISCASPRAESQTDRCPSAADAIVVLAGGDGERIASAIELLRSGTTATLVLSDDGGAHLDVVSAEVKAKREIGFRMVRFRPTPLSTEGEARYVAALATRHGWRSIVLVTSSYHMRRAQFVFSRQVDCEIRLLAAPASASPRMLFHEVLGLLAAVAKAGRNRYLSDV